MNLKFLGDALDYWKGAMFASLRKAKVLRDFAADPMASDPKRWSAEDFKLYARLLRIDRHKVIQHRATLYAREAYFGEITHQGDLFLDPDTGVATGQVKAAHVSPSEIGQLLDAATGRLLVVYQHVRAKPVAIRVDEVMNSVRQAIGRLSWCSYESATVAMLFLARLPARTVPVATHFRDLLRRHADGRSRMSPLHG